MNYTNDYEVKANVPTQKEMSKESITIATTFAAEMTERFEVRELPEILNTIRSIFIERLKDRLSQHEHAVKLMSEVMDAL